MVRGIVAFVALAGMHLASAAALQEFFAKGWSRQPEARRLPALVVADRARAEMAQAGTPEPARLSLAHRNDRWGGGRGKEEWEAELAWLLWLPGQRAARQREAEAEAELTAARARAAQLAFAGRLRTAWWELGKARLAVKLAEARAQTATALADEVERRLAVGLASRLERNLAEDERLAAQAELTVARQALAEAEAAFITLAGEPAPAELAPEAWPMADQAAPLDEHPLWREKAAELRLAEAQLRQAVNAGRAAPEIAIMLAHGREDFAAPFNQTVGVKLSLPFASAARQDEATARARAAWLDSEAGLARLRMSLERDITLAREALARAEELAGQAHERARLARENREWARRAYALGEFDLAARLRHEGAARAAEAEHGRLLLVIEAARSQLKQAMGILP